jgi:hypothetical protein
MKIYPYKFWGVIICAVVMSFMCFLIVWFLYKQRTSYIIASDLNVSDVLEDSENDQPQILKEKDNPFFLENKWIKYLAFLILGVFIGSIATRLAFNNGYSDINRSENVSISNSKYLFGIDVSHYQGRINWSEVRTSHHPIEYVFMRATMGDDGLDSEYKNNWLKSKQEELI